MEYAVHLNTEIKRINSSQYAWWVYEYAQGEGLIEMRASLLGRKCVILNLLQKASLRSISKKKSCNKKAELQKALVNCELFPLDLLVTRHDMKD